ncbi:MAG: chitobiase/beta-hexosaminidase C-terminal domain-containing protein [Bacteroidaceae bacterium]|nr:chitobiase/beta-hexosaminidase C-terminal domain-containing protein [Bacteroidaceae bacterium]
MRKFYSLLVALLALVGVAQAQTITFDATVDKGNNTTASGADQVSKSGVTIATTAGGLGTGSQYRFAKNSTTTISTTSGTIASITFTCTASGTAQYGPGCFAEQTGYSYEGNTGVWTGNAASVQFVASGAQVRATKIEIVLKNDDPNYVAAPKITPATGTYYSAQEVTITSTDADAVIYYTVDGADPRESGMKYAAPFTLAEDSETTTVKAAAQKNDHWSDVAESVITIEKLQTQNIASVLTAGVGAASVSATVVAVGQSGFLLGDNSGYIYAYTGAAPEVAVGDVVAVSGNTTEYGGRLQFASPSVQKTGTTSVTYPEPTVLDGAAFAALATPTVSYVQFDATVKKSGNYYNLTVAGSSKTGSLLAPTDVLAQIEDGSSIKVTGFFVYIASNYVYVIATKVDLPEVAYSEFNNFAAVKEAAPESDAQGSSAIPAQLNLTNALVTYVNGQSVYLYDGQDGILVFGTNSKNLKTGDKISGTIKGKLYRRYGNAQLASPAYDVTVNSSDNAVEPQKVAATDLLANGAAYENELIVLENLVAQATAFESQNLNFEAYTDDSFETSAGIVAVRDNWSVATSMVFTDELAYTVTGLVALYTSEAGTIVQIYPRSAADLDNGEEQPTYEFEGDGTLEKPYTVADIQHKEANDTKTNLEENVWVKAYIVGYINGNSLSATSAMFSADAPEGTDKDGNPLKVTASNILVGDAASAATVADVIPVQLPTGTVREGLNLADNAGNLGKQVWMCGHITKYMGVPALKTVHTYSFDGVTFTGVNSIAAEAAPAAQAIYTVAGQRVQNMNKAGLYIVGGKKVVIK